MMQAGNEQLLVHQVRHGHLVDPPQALVIRMGDDPVDELIIDTDKSIYRVVDNFMKKP